MWDQLESNFQNFIEIKVSWTYAVGKKKVVGNFAAQQNSIFFFTLFSENNP